MKLMGVKFFIFILLGFGLGIALTQGFYQFKLKKIRSSTLRYINSLLGLSISHLHDAANFFGLIKLSINQDSPQHSYNFAKGASFHFRSLFEELKNSINNIHHNDFNFERNIEVLYAKEKLDLKDLLEMELFQISNFNRIKFIDQSESEHSFIHGNFNLLSKSLLNLIENALKYTEGEIRIELKEASPYWLIKVISIGKEIPRDIIHQIQTKDFKANIGHGLSYLSNIIDFHDGKIEISSFENEGSSINIYIKKSKNLGNIMQERQTKQQKNQNLKSIFKNKLFLYPILTIAILFLGLYSIQQSRSREVIQASISRDYLINDLLNQTDLALEHSKDISQTETAIENLEAIEKALLANIKEDKRNYAKKVYLSYIYEQSNTNLNAYIHSKAKDPQILLKSNAHFYLADQEFSKKNFLSSITEFYKALQALLYRNILIDPDMVAIDRLFEAPDFRAAVEDELNKHLDPTKEIDQSAGLFQGPKYIPMSKPKVDPKTLPSEQNKEDHLIYLIDRRDKEVGNDEFEF